jgi:hypothetical protein
MPVFIEKKREREREKKECIRGKKCFYINILFEFTAKKRQSVSCTYKRESEKFKNA